MDSLTWLDIENQTDRDTESAAWLDQEKALVESARRDPAAFSRLYRHYVTGVYRYLYQWVRNASEAEDLTAQVFSDVLERLALYQERGTFAAWLFTIARRKAITAYRGRSPSFSLEEAEDLPDGSEDPLEQVVHGEQRERMAALFAQLDDDQRELLRLRFTAGLGYAQIGAVLGRSEAAVKMAVYRLLRQMNAQWEK